MGDRIDARVRGSLVDNDYVWTWEWQVIDAAGTPRGKPAQQSTFLSRGISSKALGHLSNQRTPEVGTKLILDRDCLALVGEGRTLDAIARPLQERHPEHLTTYKAAIDHATKCLSRYVG